MIADGGIPVGVLGYVIVIAVNEGGGEDIVIIVCQAAGQTIVAEGINPLKIHRIGGIGQHVLRALSRSAQNVPHNVVIGVGSGTLNRQTLRVPARLPSCQAIAEKGLMAARTMHKVHHDVRGDISLEQVHHRMRVMNGKHLRIPGRRRKDIVGGIIVSKHISIGAPADDHRAGKVVENVVLE